MSEKPMSSLRIMTMFGLRASAASTAGEPPKGGATHIDSKRRSFNLFILSLFKTGFTELASGDFLQSIPKLLADVLCGDAQATDNLRVSRCDIACFTQVSFQIKQRQFQLLDSVPVTAGYAVHP